MESHNLGPHNSDYQMSLVARKPVFRSVCVLGGERGVNPRSSLEQTMMGWSPQCYIQSFEEIGPPVPEKEIFEGFLPYMGLAAILVKSYS